MRELIEEESINVSGGSIFTDGNTLGLPVWHGLEGIIQISFMGMLGAGVFVGRVMSPITGLTILGVGSISGYLIFYYAELSRQNDFICNSMV